MPVESANKKVRITMKAIQNAYYLLWDASSSAQQHKGIEVDIFPWFQKIRTQIDRKEVEKEQQQQNK